MTTLNELLNDVDDDVVVIHIERDLVPDACDRQDRSIVVVEDQAGGAVLFEVTISGGRTTAVVRAFENGEPVSAQVLSLDGAAMLSR